MVGSNNNLYPGLTEVILVNLFPELSIWILVFNAICHFFPGHFCSISFLYIFSLLLACFNLLCIFESIQSIHLIVKV
jgi:hypothetical protein